MSLDQLSRTCSEDVVDVFRDLVDDVLPTNGAQPAQLARRPQAHAHGWADLFSLAVLDDLLAGTALRGPYLHLVRDGVPVDPSLYATSTEVAGFEVAEVPDADTVYALFATGVSLVLKHLEHVHRPLRELCAFLAERTRHSIDAQAFVTPPGSRALRTHYDNQDLFIVQFAGSKRWRIYERSVVDPVDDHVYAGDGPRLVQEFTMSAGDFLYVPAGYPHMAEASEFISGHLTIVVDNIQARDILLRLCDGLSRYDGLGRPAPRRRPTESDLTSLTTLVRDFGQRLGTVSATGIADALAQTRQPEPTLAAPCLDHASRAREGVVCWSDTPISLTGGVLTVGNIELDVDDELARWLKDARPLPGTEIADLEMLPPVVQSQLVCLLVMTGAADVATGV